MNAPSRTRWTPELFLDWAVAQGGRYEFDGTEPVAMTGGTVNHGLVMRNLHRLLEASLHGSPFIALGPDVGVETGEGRIRYPDALVTCAELTGTARTVPGVMAVFEIVSPGSERVDRLLKLREYCAVPSILHYVIIESTTRGATSLRRGEDGSDWVAVALTEADTLAIPEIGVRIPVGDLYARVALDAAEGGG
jgi:Uma2 family endonuclease